MGFSVFAGDVSEKMSRRTAANLEKLFPASVAFMSEEACESSRPLPPALLQQRSLRKRAEVRHWDATRQWPLSDTIAEAGGADILVATNLPWGGKLHGQEEEAFGVVRCLLQSYPRATFCIIAPECVRELLAETGRFQLAYEAPAGNKKCTLFVGRGGGDESL